MTNFDESQAEEITSLDSQEKPANERYADALSERLSKIQPFGSDASAADTGAAIGDVFTFLLETATPYYPFAAAESNKLQESLANQITASMYANSKDVSGVKQTGLGNGDLDNMRAQLDVLRAAISMADAKRGPKKPETTE